MFQTLLDVRPGPDGWPDDWLDEVRGGGFKRGVLRNGALARAAFMLPGRGWARLRVEILFEPGEDSAVDFGDGRTKVLISFGAEPHRLMPHEGATLAMSRRPAPPGNQARLVVFELDRGQWRGMVDGVEMISHHRETAASIAGLVTLSFYAGGIVHRVHVRGDGELPAPLHGYPPRRDRDFCLEVTVDFPDDLHYAPYTPEMMDGLFAEYARWGVRRCDWIYGGQEEHHWWRYFREPIYGNYLKTLENLGGEIFDAAVRAGHAHGVEVHGLFKPFEMGHMLHTYGEGTEQARRFGRYPRIGGVIGRCPDFTVAHRELMTRRKPDASGPALNSVFTRIDLVSCDDRPAAFDACNVRIFVSNDNNTYRPYDGPCRVEEVLTNYPVYRHTGAGGQPTEHARRSRVIRLTELDIRSRFLAVAAPSGGRGSFGNKLVDLVHVFGPSGEERRITLGTVPRAGRLVYRIEDATVSDSHGLDFCRCGIEFDNVEGMPSACLAGYDGIREWHAFDGGHGFIGIARGKDDTPAGVLSPSFPATREWWLQWVREILEAGADGVELRVRNHHSHLAWGEFGFEAPVRDAFLSRHGVDIWETDDFDPAAWRRLRGEAYTQFYREARQLVDAYGKRMGVHVSQTMDMEPEEGAAMGIHFDWRSWIDEGMADSVTLKEIRPRTAFGEEIFAHTRPRGATVVFSPYANNIWKGCGGARICADRIRFAREHGCDGFQFYENCAIMRAQPNGYLKMVQPELREVFRREFRR